MSLGQRGLDGARERAGEGAAEANEEEREVGEGDVGAQRPLATRPPDDPLDQAGRLVAQRGDLGVVHGDLAEKGRHHRADAQVERTSQVAGERRTLPLVARYAHACNLRPGPDIPQKLDLLRRLCEAEGRDDDAIETTCPWRFDVGEHGENVATLVEQLRGFAEMGIETVFGRVVGDHTIRPIELMGREVIPAIAAL